MQIIRTPQGKNVVINGQSAGQLAKHPAFAGNIGKTSILEMLRGQRKQAKGYSICEIEKPYIANKYGIESVGTSTKRHRLPMRIFCQWSGLRGINSVKDNDFGRFCKVIAKHKSEIEYPVLCEKMGWTRNMVSIYAARAKNLGYIDIRRESQTIKGK